MLTADPPLARPGALRRLLAPEAPLARVAAIRAAISVFVICDVFWIIDDPIAKAEGPAELYRPLLLRRLLELPVPAPEYVRTLQVVVVVAALVAATGRLPRLAGAVVALGFLDWVSIGYSYSKIDHDHFALVVATFVLPTVGRAGLRDTTRSEAAGWALLAIRLGCVATYFLSAVAKMRFGGWGWAGGSVFAWAMTRRGTGLGRLLLEPPWILRLGQWSVLVMEFLSPLLLVLRGRLLHLFVATLCLFHLATWLTLRIHFLPLVVCLLAFLPVERMTIPLLDRWRPRQEAPGTTTPAS